jgi:hypothetical protein
MGTRRAVVNLTDELEAAIEAYRRDQDARPSLSGVTQAALREFLRERGYLPSSRPPYITPSDNDSGASDISVDHDRYFAEG